MFLSILSGSRSTGGGEVREECREQGPLSPSPFFLPFSSPPFFSALRLGVTAPVCGLVFEPESKRVKGFVCFDDCRQTLSGWKCLTTVQLLLQAAAEGHESFSLLFFFFFLNPERSQIIGP